MKRVSFVLAIALALVASPAAIALQDQATTQTQQPGQGRGGQQPNTTTAQQGLVFRGALGRNDPLPVNVKLDLTISDQSGNSQAVVKTISMLLADWGTGRVRSTGSAIDADGIPRYSVQLNADAEVRMVTEDRARATITIEYTTTPSSPAEVVNTARRPLPPPSLNETVTVLLTSGKATVITQSADPTSDRKVTVSATATVSR